MRGLRRAGATLAAALALVLAAVAVWAGYQFLRDPVAALDRDPGMARVIVDSAYPGVTAAGERRIYRDLTFATAEAGTVSVTASRPAEPAARQLPLALILGGLRTGREALAFVPRHGPNHLVAYEYPRGGEGDIRIEGVGDVLSLRSAILGVPAQVVAVAAVLRERPGVDPDRTSLLGYSFGALFAPAAQRLAGKRGIPFRAVVLAYGGADLARLVRANLDLEPAPLRATASWLVAAALRPVEPAVHLPHLTGEFLIMGGTGDERIPPASRHRLAELTPEPKEVVRLEGAHMGPGRTEVNERVVRTSQEWLARRGHVEPSDGGWP